MIDVERLSVLNIQIQNEDVEYFSNIITKLLKETRAAGFKKPYTEEEQNVILSLANALGIKEDNGEGGGGILMLQKQ